MKRFRGVGILPLLVPFFLFPALFSCTIPGRGRGECSPEQVGRQVIENLLARPDLMIYQTPQAHGIHYAEACAGFGAARLAGALKDPVLLKKLVQRYAIERTDTIPNSVLPGSKNTVKMGIGVQQNREQEYSKNGNKNTVISINIINQGLHCIINKKQDCDGLKNKITYHYVSRDSQAS